MRRYLQRLSERPLFRSLKSIINPIRSGIHKRFFSLMVPEIPNSIIVEVTNACNLKCPFCYQSNPGFRIPKGFMDFDLFSKAVIEFVSMRKRKGISGTVVLYATGEIFLHKRWKEMISFCTKLGQSSVISTNGLLMGKDAIDGILESGLKQLRLSIEGYDKETYESKRVNGNFEQLIGNLKYMKEVFSKFPKAKPSVIIRAVLFPQEHSRHYYKRFFDLWGKYVDVINFIPFQTQHGQMIDQVSSKNLSGKRKPCLFPFNSLTINYNGSVGFCCADYNHNIDVGRFPDSSLQEIWKGVKLNQIRDIFRKNKYDSIPQICRQCENTFYVDNPDYKIVTFNTNKKFEEQLKRLK